MSDAERSRVVREICATPGVLTEEQRTRLLRALLPGREIWICTLGQDYGHHMMAWHTEGVYVDLLDARTLVVSEEHRRVGPERAKHSYDVKEPGEVWVDDETEQERTFTPWKVESATQRFRDQWAHKDVK